MGTIDGNATANDWYAWAAKEGPDQTLIREDNANAVPIAQRIFGTGNHLRPSLIEFMRCTNILFADFTAKNSPFWTIHPVFGKNITARGFHSLGSVGNTDGFDPEPALMFTLTGRPSKWATTQSRSRRGAISTKNVLHADRKRCHRELHVHEQGGWRRHWK